eukprot:g20371.t1
MEVDEEVPKITKSLPVQLQLDIPHPPRQHEGEVVPMQGREAADLPPPYGGLTSAVLSDGVKNAAAAKPKPEPKPKLLKRNSSSGSGSSSSFSSGSSSSAAHSPAMSSECDADGGGVRRLKKRKGRKAVPEPAVVENEAPVVAGVLSDSGTASEQMLRAADEACEAASPTGAGSPVGFDTLQKLLVGGGGKENHCGTTAAAAVCRTAVSVSFDEVDVESGRRGGGLGAGAAAGADRERKAAGGSTRATAPADAGQQQAQGQAAFHPGAAPADDDLNLLPISFEMLAQQAAGPGPEDAVRPTVPVPDPEAALNEAAREVEEQGSPRNAAEMDDVNANGRAGAGSSRAISFADIMMNCHAAAAGPPLGAGQAEAGAGAIMGVNVAGAAAENVTNEQMEAEAAGAQEQGQGQGEPETVPIRPAELEPHPGALPFRLYLASLHEFMIADWGAGPGPAVVVEGPLAGAAHQSQHVPPASPPALVVAPLPTTPLPEGAVVEDLLEDHMAAEIFATEILGSLLSVHPARRGWPPADRLRNLEGILRLPFRSLQISNLRSFIRSRAATATAVDHNQEHRLTEGEGLL